MPKKQDVHLRSTPVRGVAGAVTALLTLTTVLSASAQAETVGILVLKEHGVGSPSLAQPYLDRFVAIAAEQNDWSDAKGVYYTNRNAAEAYIEEQKPHYAILSLAPFLALKDKYHLQVIGQVAVTLVGGKQYYLISKRATDFAGCEGKTLATDHADDVRFINTVVANGKFKLADFKVLPTQRPLQTIKKVLDNQADCALIDDAQQNELSHLDGADGVRPVWTSAELPPMVVVAFPDAPADERKRFQDNLANICDDDGKSACAEVGIVSLRAASAKDYAGVVAVYGK
jgi:ABC transporter, phosphonate, periplasmic substrate-binding protein